MSKLSIYESGWINLVFEGRNKQYGAYQLRQETAKTTMTAFGIALLLIAGIETVSIIFTYLSAKNVPSTVIPNLDTIVHVVNIEPFRAEPKTAVVPPAKKQADDVKPEKQLSNPVIVSPIDANDIEKNKNNTPMAVATGELGTAINPGLASSPGPITTVVPTIYPAGINMTTALDKLPEYPGGIDKFYAYVGRTFEKPEIDYVKTIKVYVSFVIELDGTMTDIQLRRDPGYGLGKEAVRVLKSLKTKWSPGMIAGKPVRTAYNLPLLFKCNEGIFDL